MDDDKIILNGLKQSLEKEGYDRRCARAYSSLVEKIDTLVQKEAYLIDQFTKDVCEE